MFRPLEARESRNHYLSKSDLQLVFVSEEILSHQMDYLAYIYLNYEIDKSESRRRRILYEELDPYITFIHQTFQEYLLAEVYLEILLGTGPHRAWMNITLPSKETMEFLTGMIELIKSDNTLIQDHFIISKLETVESEVESAYPMGLLNSFNYCSSVEKAVNTIKLQCEKNIEDTNIEIIASRIERKDNPINNKSVGSRLSRFSAPTYRLQINP